VATCVRWVCHREQASGAEKKVNTAISAGQDIMGASGNIMEHHGECNQAEQLFKQLHGVERTL